MGSVTLVTVSLRRFWRTTAKLPIILLLNGVLWSFIFLHVDWQADRRLHLKIYAVGEGDAIFIRTPSQKKILIDGGPGDKVLDFLSKDLPFYDRTLDLLVLTHPHADHLNGLLSVLRRYQVKRFLFNPVGLEGTSYQELTRLLVDNQVPLWSGFAGELLRLGEDGSSLRILWPTDKGVLADPDPNASSLVLLLSFGDFQALLLGDLDKINQTWLPTTELSGVEVLKVPHQGAASALNESFLEKVKPQLAVISVGKNNYGHPSSAVLSAYSVRGIPLWRTDEQGTVEIVSNGHSWSYWALKNDWGTILSSIL